MYLGGVSLTVRSAFVFVAFSLVLIVSRSLPAASVAMAIAALLEVAAVTLPLAHLESEKSRRPTLSNVLGLFAQSWPLFAALFSYTLIENMPARSAPDICVTIMVRIGKTSPQLPMPTTFHM